jgi:hypothetical protein
MEAVIAPEPPKTVELVEPLPLRDEDHQLADYLKQATLSWMKLTPNLRSFEKAEHETQSVVIDRIDEVSLQVEDVIRHGYQGHREAVIWDDDRSGARTGLLVMGVAFFETRYRGYVDSGKCNDPTWRKSKEAGILLALGTCDGSHAYSAWQIHCRNGMYLTWDADEYSSVRLRSDAVLVNPKGILEDRRLAITGALHMLRKAVRRTRDLRDYSGEPSDYHPKADVRLALAVDYEKAHPYMTAR